MSARLRAAGCVFADDEARVLLEAASDDADLAQMLGRREAGEPLEYVVGWAEFDGLRIPVLPGVFIPRRRTHALLAQALHMVGHSARVLELCCAAAPVAAAMRARRPDLRVCASDINPDAVACALRSVPEVYCGDLFAPVPRQRFDLIVANAPYVPSGALGTLPRESRREAVAALDGGPDGLDVHRRIAAQAADWLGSGGSVLCEVSPEQAEALTKVYSGYTSRVYINEDLDVAVVACTRKASK